MYGATSGTPSATSLPMVIRSRCSRISRPRVGQVPRHRTHINRLGSLDIRRRWIKKDNGARYRTGLCR